MLSRQTMTAVADLAAAVLAVRPLAGRMERPLRVAVPAGTTRGALDGTQAVLDRVCARLAAPRMELVPPLDSPALGPFSAAVGRRLRLAELAPDLADAPAIAGSDLDPLIDGAAARDFEGLCERAVVRVPDGAALQAYAAGPPGAPAVVLASACGMPARLAEAWIRRLAVDHRVLTWESRWLFGERDPHGPGGSGSSGSAALFDGDTGVPAQVGDLLAVMDHFGVDRAHVAGLCGGAVIAVSAAAGHPERVGSLSLWHGDFELGDERLKTDHQRNLRALMELAAQTEAGAAGVHAVLCRSIAATVPPDLAHLVLYPYADSALLFRYCRLNGAIMGTDLRPVLAGVGQPTLVVTSLDDTTAHPAGSRFVAAALPSARLRVVPHGDHISLFRGPSESIDAAARFAAEQRS